MGAKKWQSSRIRDRQLVAACLRRDEDAWREIWQRYGPLVKAVARRTGCDSEEAKDVLQRVGLIAIQGLERLQDRAKLAGWLAGVARFQSMEVLRQRRPGEQVYESTAVVAQHIEDDIAQNQQMVIVRRSMLQLGDRCRRLISSLDLGDEPTTYAEFARAEGLSATSIGPIRRRCLNSLRKIIEKMSQSEI